MSHYTTYRFSHAAPLSWSQLERILSGKESGGLRAVGIAEGTGEYARGQSFAVHPVEEASGSQEQRKVAAFQVPFAELHPCSAYSFLRGASTPEVMARQARKLGISAIACLDRDGFYGAARLAMAAAEAGVNTVFGAELSVNGKLNHPLTVLCRGQEGYRRLSRLITQAAMADRDKDTVIYPPLEEIAAASRGEDGTHGAATNECAWIILLDWAWIRQPARADKIVEFFGEENCVIELAHTMDPADWDRNVALHAFAQENGLREIVSAQPTCATPASARLAGVKGALHRRKDISAAEALQHPTGGNWLRSGEEMLNLAGDCPWLAQAVTSTVEIAEECAFTLNLIAPPSCRTSQFQRGHTEMSWLREVTERGGTHRYGPRTHNNSATVKAWHTIDKELATIEALGFPGYFLIVYDIVSFCHDNSIFCQGRGSAANSAVCFALGITTVDAVAAGLLFERFLSPERDGPPDTDLDIESGRREEAIQYVYSRYGRDNAAQVANVITYRRKGAVRDAARALGYAPGQVDAWTRGLEPAPEVVQQVAEQLLDHPRHLGIHSGGMVICDRAIADVVPTEWARMDNRSVVQWDKDDCAAVGLVKFDLLGLGMLEAIHHAVDQVDTHRGRRIELWRLDPVEREVYAMLCRADAVGVFQVESRAQMNTLPRLKPRTFFDLVVQVALIRPGPIQGGSVHPFIRRRNGEEPVTFDHPCLQPALEKTLGIPLFQEQLMQVVVDAAGFSGAEADSLRRAMGSKRSPEMMECLRARFYQGLAETNGITGEVADTLWNKIVAFAAYGFPESHAQSFASLVYYSAWFKYHYPAEFCVALLRAQPMGFYSPQSLIADARRHGVRILPVDINESYAQPDTVVEGVGGEHGYEQKDGRSHTPRGIHGLGRAEGEPVGAIRLGLAAIGGIGEKVADKIVDVRERIGRFTHVSQLSREVGLTVAQVEHLAKAGALNSLGMDRRQAVWAAGIAATEQAGMLPETSEITAPALPGMNAFELAAADLAVTGMTPAGHPVELLRSFLQQWHRQPSIGGVNSGRVRGGAAVVASQQLKDIPDGTRIRVAGVITHRQAPRTAGGVVFMGLEDETGLANVIVPKGLWNKQRVEALSAKIVVIRGIVHNASGVASVTADLIEPVEPVLRPAAQLANSSGGARDFR